MSSRRSTSPSASPSGAGSRASTRSAISTSATSPPQPAHDLRHLDTDRPTAEYEQAARDGRHRGRLAIGPDALELAEARDRRHDRLRAGRDHDVLGGVAHAVDLDHARPGEPAVATQQGDARARQPALLAGVGVVRDHEVTPGERGPRRRPARAPLPRSRHAPPRPGAAASSTGCTPSRSTRPRPARARRARRADRPRPARRRSARPANRRR